jgi:hypothetical protein
MESSDSGFGWGDIGKLLLGLITEPFIWLFENIGKPLIEWLSHLGDKSGGNDQKVSSVSKDFGDNASRKPDTKSTAPDAKSNLGATSLTSAFSSSGTPGYDAQAARAKLGERNVEALDPQFQDPVKRIMARLEQKGWNPQIGSGIRDKEEQKKKVDQKLSATMDSKHLVGLAVDIVNGPQQGRKGSGWDGEYADRNHPFWKDLQEAAEEVGMISGSRWTKEKDGIEADLAHVQFRRPSPQLVANSQQAPGQVRPS